MTEKRPLYWMGTDEAGYGPNLGPLSIGGALFLIAPVRRPKVEFQNGQFLKEADRLDWHKSWKTQPCTENPKLPPIDDSKKSYSSGDSLQNLHSVTSSLLHFLDPDSDPGFSKFEQLWKNVRLSDREDLLKSVYWFSKKLGSSGSLLTLGKKEWWDGHWFTPKAAAVELTAEPQFNKAVEKYGNKASLLSLSTLNLVKSLLDKTDPEADVVVDCDRHGGRKKYLPLLLEVFGADWMKTVEEAKGRSIYYWETNGGRRVYFRFEVKGERRFPVAVASQLAKYLRERSMEQFNAFWKNCVKDIRPTAGYPVDAKRFYEEIQPVMQKKSLTEAEVWRCC